MPHIPDSARLSVAPVLEAAAARYTKGRPAVLAKALGFPKTTLHGWIKGTSIPSLSHACDLATRLGVSLSDLYLGNKVALPDQPLLMLDGPKKRHRRMRIDWPAVDQQLQGYLRVAEPVSVRQIAAELGVSRRTLYSHDEVLMKRLAARYEAWQLGNLEGIARERLEAIHGLLDACEDEDLILPGKVRKDFERLGHSMSWWGFGRLYQAALRSR
jgi:transcriptional regulator with XRE-family HTH domain